MKSNFAHMRPGFKLYLGNWTANSFDIHSEERSKVAIMTSCLGFCSAGHILENWKRLPGVNLLVVLLWLKLKFLPTKYKKCYKSLFICTPPPPLKKSPNFTGTIYIFHFYFFIFLCYVYP